MGYGFDTIHLLFNLCYRDISSTPAYENNMPQVDSERLKAMNPWTLCALRSDTRPTHRSISGEVQFDATNQQFFAHGGTGGGI